MREIDPALQAKLDSGCTTLCRCWLVERADGERFGFTDHDRDLSFDGVTFLAGTGLDAAALQSSTGLSVDNSQAVGALSSAGLLEDDIHGGRYDRAAVWQWYVDWTQVDLRVLMFRGYLGEIRRAEGAFEAELRGLSEDLNRTVGKSYLYQCPRTLGDDKCGFDTSTFGYAVDTTVVQTDGRKGIVISEYAGQQDGWFEHGQVKWTGGAWIGHVAQIKFDRVRNGARHIEFWLETPFEIGLNDPVRVMAGCDKQPDTCQLKFNNFLNYRGFPHMPGEDWVTSYPAEGGTHDGASMRNG